MNERMNGQNKAASTRHQEASEPSKKKSPLGDYIDFEEVKE